MYKKVILAIGMFLVFVNFTQAENPYLFFSEQRLVELKIALKSNNKTLEPYARVLKEAANRMMHQGPWSLTYSKSPAVSGNPHDYFSESPYWWPNPEDPDGPYIRKDGVRNPERFMAHKDALKSMVQAVSILSMAAYVFDNPAYAQQATKILRIWFLDEKTKMNPHLNYAQAIRNKSPGRGVGIIDTHRFIYFVEFLNLLEQSSYWDEQERAALQDWFKQYTDWLLYSKNGLKEKYQGNNHTTWWCGQVAACGFFVNDKSVRDSVWHYVKTSVLNAQLEADGTMPEELARTKSFSYSIFNLNAFSLLGTMAELDGINLWMLQNQKGGSLGKAVNFIQPFIQEPESWTYPQIIPWEQEAPYLLYFSGQALDRPDLIQLYEKLNAGINIEGYSKDIFTFLINMSLAKDN